MEGKITGKGDLEIKRNGSYKRQLCLYSNAHTCGDWCPQFGEPDWYPKDENLPDKANLNICQNRVLKFGLFEDERG